MNVIFNQLRMFNVRLIGNRMRMKTVVVVVASTAVLYIVYCCLTLWSSRVGDNVNFVPVVMSRRDGNNATVVVSGEQLDCRPGVPCVYPDRVDLRIIVMTFSREKSLTTLLTSLNKLETDGATVGLEIWIDRDKKQQVYKPTVDAANAFVFALGKKRVHVQQRHVGIYGQWIDTWRPLEGSQELALMLEDDLSVSPYAWRWVHYYCLQMKTSLSPLKSHLFKHPVYPLNRYP